MFEIVFEKYGKAILVVLTLLALGGILVVALKSDGYVAQAFQSALTSFFDKMNGLLPSDAGAAPAGLLL